MSMKPLQFSLATTPEHKDFSDRYLVRLGVTNTRELDYNGLRKYFLFGIDDFLSEQICLDQLAGLASEVWSPPETNDDPEIGKLKSALEACSELSFYVRKMATIPELQTSFLQFFVEVMQYYTENQRLI